LDAATGDYNISDIKRSIRTPVVLVHLVGASKAARQSGGPKGIEQLRTNGGLT
jgi:hypothetical protein